MTKLTRKLFISIMTLVLTVMALGTSTFAWFSMNTTVNANSMTVTAKSNATYLFIANSVATTNEGVTTYSAPTIAQIQAGTLTAVTTQKVDGTADNDRYPCEFNNTGAATYVPDKNGSYTATAQDTNLTEGEKYTSVANQTWYTASSTSSASATTDITNVKTIASGDLDKYTVKYDVYLALSPDSEDYAAGNYVKLTFSLGENDDAAISAVVLIQGSYYKLDSTNNEKYHQLTAAITGDTETPGNIRLCSSSPSSSSRRITCSIPSADSLSST